MTEPLRMSFDVACSAEHAFTVWTARIGTWWPADHTVTGRAEAAVLQGDVGAGKTVVAVWTLLAAVEGGHQGAFMAPTEVLAEQHFTGIRPLLEGISVPDDGVSLFGDRPLTVELLTNKVTGKERQRVLGALADRTSMHPGPHGTAVTISFRLGPADGRPFTLSQRSRGACTVLAVSGQLDLNSAGQLTEAVGAQLAGTSAPCLVIDLGELVSWDVFGVAALLRAQAQADAGPSARLVLADVPGPLQHHLTETGLASRFTMADSADDVLGDTSRPQSGRAQQGGLSPQP